MTEPGTVLITGPTRNLGRHTVLALAGRPEAQRPDLLLVGRAGPDLTAVADEARALGARVREIGCDLASLADVRGAAATARDLLAAGAVRPLRALVANAGLMSADTRRASVDGYELTFAVNYLAHAQLIGDLLGSFAAPARVVLIGSNTYHANFWRKLLHVPEADWADPVELARPAHRRAGPGHGGLRRRLLQRQAGDPVLRPRAAAPRRSGRRRVGVRTGLDARHRTGPRRPRGVPGDEPRPGPDPRRVDAAAARDHCWPRWPSTSKWAHLRDGAFVVKTG